MGCADQLPSLSMHRWILFCVQVVGLIVSVLLLPL